MTEIEMVKARQDMKKLVDKYATESDRNNQDYYVNVFTEDCHVRVYFNNQVGMEFTNVQDMIKAYKSFGAAKESFYINGQQVVEFQDDDHASGTCYAMANLVQEKDGEDILTTLSPDDLEKILRMCLCGICMTILSERKAWQTYEGN